MEITSSTTFVKQGWTSWESEKEGQQDSSPLEETQITAHEYSPSQVQDFAKHGFELIDLKEHGLTDEDVKFLGEHTLESPEIKQRQALLEKVTKTWGERKIKNPATSFKRENLKCMDRDSASTGWSDGDKPVVMAHIDYNKEKMTGLDESDTTSFPINIWVPLNTTPSSPTLVMMDKSTFDKKDRVEGLIEGTLISHNSDQKWHHFFPRLILGQAIVFDNTLTAHTALHVPGLPATRRSIELGEVLKFQA
jgi:hypothetical protein